MEKEIKPRRYILRRGEVTTLSVDRNTRLAVESYARLEGLTMNEATNGLIKIGLKFEMIRRERREREKPGY